MHPPIIPLGPNLREQHLHLLRTPLQTPRKHRRTNPMQALLHSHQIQQPTLPQSLILRPGPDRQAVFLDGDVDEAGGGHGAGELCGLEARFEGVVRDGDGALVHEVAPLRDGGGGG